MNRTIWIGLLAIAAACASAAPKPDPLQGVTRWEGHMFRNRLQSPIAVALSVEGENGAGQLTAGDNSVELDNVRVSAMRVHFELAGDAVFDGTVVEDRMVGSVTGCTSGLFEMSRQESPHGLYFLGP